MQKKEKERDGRSMHAQKQDKQIERNQVDAVSGFWFFNFLAIRRCVVSDLVHK